MNSYRIRRIVSVAIICVFVFSTFGITSVQAGIIPTFGVNSATACATGIVVDYHYTGTPTTFDVSVWDAGYVNQIAGKTIASGNGSSIVVKLTFSTTQSVGSIVNVEFQSSSGGGGASATVFSSCDTDSGVELPCFTDGRLDPYDCAAPVAIYVTDEAEGWMLQAWRIEDSDGVGHFLYTLFEEDVPEPGDNPILLHSEDSIRLYLLPTGEFEIIAPYPKEPTKFYVFIFTLPDGEGYRADFGTGTGR